MLNMQHREHVRIEIAVQDVAGARTAKHRGADRVELCSALTVGGLTPSWGATKAVVSLGVETHALIRPRAGGFQFSEEEIIIMIHDIWALKEIGVQGIVVGALLPDRMIDESTMRRLCVAAEGLDMTFHRAIDVVPDPFAALDVLIDVGVQRVLTSGQEATAAQGIQTMAAMVDHAAGRIDIQAGGSITADTIPSLVAIGVRNIHLSARRSRSDAGPSGPGGGGAVFDTTDPLLVDAAVAATRVDGNFGGSS